MPTSFVSLQLQVRHRVSTDEKNKIKQLVIDVNRGRVPILIGCGGNNTRAVVEELKTTDWTGIDGILSVCPYYNKPSQEGLYQRLQGHSRGKSVASCAI